ncbi:MAG: hypothetical protein ABIP20_11725 [Chthoniobacteraceae bacterium]
MAIVLRKASRLIVILALLASVGGHWALLQSVAWTRMIIERTHTDSFATAVQTTLDGEHPCDMCKRITEGKQSEQQEEKVQVKVKLDMLCELRLIAIAPPSQPLNFPSDPTEGTPRAECPPVPPPRLA